MRNACARCDAQTDRLCVSTCASACQCVCARPNSNSFDSLLAQVSWLLCARASHSSVFNSCWLLSFASLVARARTRIAAHLPSLTRAFWILSTLESLMAHLIFNLNVLMCFYLCTRIAPSALSPLQQQQQRRPEHQNPSALVVVVGVGVDKLFGRAQIDYQGNLWPLIARDRLSGSLVCTSH